MLIKDEPFSPEEAEFFIEYVTQEELEMLREGVNPGGQVFTFAICRKSDRPWQGEGPF